MLLGLLALTLVAIALALPTVLQAGRRLSDRAALRRSQRRVESGLSPGDPGRERRAEQRARELLRSCVNDEEWAMYRDLGFIRVHGHRTDATPRPGYAYLVYPNKPVVAFVPGSGRVLNEYCVEFPDMTLSRGHSRLPASDDVLAKWMALTGDEERLIRSANMHLPGRQVDPARVRRDIWRLTEWERQRARSQSRDSQTQLDA